MQSVCDRPQATAEAEQVLEPLMVAYQDAMACVEGLATWLADVYLKNIPVLPNYHDSVSANGPSEHVVAERSAFGRVLTLLGSLATSHTVDLRPAIINVVYKALLKVLDAAAPLMPSPGFWNVGFEGQALAQSMLHTVDIKFGELFLLSPGEWLRTLSTTP
jgi:hypothetical protein